MNIKTILLSLSFIFISLSLAGQSMSKKDCEQFYKIVGEKDLECIQAFETANPQNIIYQIFKWSAFRKSYLIQVEKNGKGYFLIQKEISENKYNESTDTWSQEVKTLKKEKLTKEQFSSFENVLDKRKFWEKKIYKVTPICTDGGGIDFKAIHGKEYRDYSNGNCAPVNEYLNVLYKEIMINLNLQ